MQISICLLNLHGKGNIMYIHRIAESAIVKSIRNFPVTAVTGPRQCGKSTLVKHIMEQYPESIYLDLERPSDLAKLDNAEWFLILGSASRDLLKQSSETLAGRIIYKRLTPFLWEELEGSCSIEHYFNAGAFPRSLLANDEEISFEWRENFIATFLERDLLQWSGFTPQTMRRLWQMLAHVNGQTVNYSTLGNSLGINSTTVKNYIDLLAGTYMVDIVQPYISNLGKRLVKSPKVYIADSGITAALLQLHNFENLSGHPAFGSIWEQIVLSNVKGLYPDATFFFYRTTNGAEADFVMVLRNKVFVLECKASYSPLLSKGNYNAFEDINPAYTFVITPSPESWPMKEGIDVVSLHELKRKIDSIESL